MKFYAILVCVCVVGVKGQEEGERDDTSWWPKSKKTEGRAGGAPHVVNAQLQQSERRNYRATGPEEPFITQHSLVCFALGALCVLVCQIRRSSVLGTTPEPEKNEDIQKGCDSPIVSPVASVKRTASMCGSVGLRSAPVTEPQFTRSKSLYHFSAKNRRSEGSSGGSDVEQRSPRAGALPRSASLRFPTSPSGRAPANYWKTNPSASPPSPKSMSGSFSGHVSILVDEDR